MRARHVVRIVCCAGLAAAFAVWAVSWYPAALAAEGEAKRVAAGKADESAAGLYRVPKTDNVAELMRFITRIEQYRPTSVEEEIEQQKLAPGAVKTAAERILKVEKDTSSEAYQTAKVLLLTLRVAGLADAKPAEQRAIVEEITSQLSVPEPSREAYGLAFMLSRKLEHLTDTRLAAEAYGALAKGFQASKEHELAEVGERFAGAARRLNLIGKSMKVEGLTTGGKPLDWAQYRGKVVLVDFWATWCPPCLAEMPNLKRVYREYHDRGFDIVGVSVDDDDHALEHYLDEANLPWTILHDKDPSAAESHPLSEYYGVMRFPTMMLVGKDGKVLAFDTYGDELWQQLAKLIGPPKTGAGDAGRAESKISKPVAAKGAGPAGQK